MKISTCISKLLILGLTLISLTAFAQQAPKIDPEVVKKLEAAGYETDPAVLKEIATAGVPMGRWKEGLMFDGIEPMPWLKSATNWFPGT